MPLLNYSIAIRTLGTSGDKFIRELESLHKQTVSPERIIVYIAEGYPRPSYQIGREEYVWVKKGMVAQRALRYDEISSECILLLDDDVELEPDSAEKMLRAMDENHSDCVGADTFRNQDMSLVSKCFAALSNWVLPHSDKKWAFKIHRHGSFSYLDKPENKFYWSQSCAGPCSMWKKPSLLAVRLEDEIWLDKLGFAFGDDAIEFYKLYVNGFRLGVLYNNGVQHLDGKSSSSAYHANILKFYTRSKGSMLVWWRCCYQTGSSFGSRFITAIVYAVKCIWLLFVNIASVFKVRDVRVPYYYLKGIWDAMRFIGSEEARQIPDYIIKKD